MQFFFSMLKKLFNLPDLNDIGKSFSKSLHEHLNDMQKRQFMFFVIQLIVQIAGFISILACLEDGFHWAYLLKF